MVVRHYVYRWLYVSMSIDALRKKIVTVTVFTFSFGLKVHYNQDDRKCTVIWTVLTKNVVFTEGTHVHRLQATRINLRLTRLMQTCD